MGYEFFNYEGSDVGVSKADPNMLIVAAPLTGVGNPVRVPEGAGGGTRVIVATGLISCPYGHEKQRTALLDNGVYVCDCRVCGQYLWYRAKA